MVSTSPPPKEVPSEDKRVEEDTSRRAKWWYSTSHCQGHDWCRSTQPALCHGLPRMDILDSSHISTSYILRGPGTMVLVLSWCMTLNTLWQMIQLHECVPGTRFDRYVDLGRHAFGPKLGPWIVLPQQLIVQVGCDYSVHGHGGKMP
ncbi:lysine histidine transporter-like 6 [Carya illinoinensis]|uniref:lysine histidine transporter-like 6 n=1 Tax=Carya illinoinensis TaxID=32201 RepID=UPI001C71CADE|nr:lysine histidine transporter-like 6 [Carya illinoinensis]